MPSQPQPLLPTLYYSRYPLAFLLAWTALPWVVKASESPLFANILVTEGAMALFLVTLLAFPPAWIGALTLRLIVKNQEARFGIAPPARWPAAFESVRKVQLVASLGTLSLISAVAVSWAGKPGGWMLPLSGGLAAALILAFLLDRLRLFLADRNQSLSLLHRLLRPLGPGYVHSADRPETTMTAGHLPALLALMLVLLLVVISRFAFDFTRGFNPEHPTLMMVELLAALLASALPGLSFFFDRWRVPVLLAVVPGLVLISSLENTDALFQLKPRSEGILDPASAHLPLDRVRRLPKGRPIVVVCTAGGGIQASAWTAAVMSGLDRSTGGAFSDSLVFVSGISGGAAGLMHFLAPYREGGLPRVEEKIHSFQDDRIYSGASTSSLFATGWGVVNGDLPRLLVPILTPLGRGWAQEQAWRWNTNSVREGAEEGANAACTTFGALSSQLERYELPGVAFHSTVVETGRPMIISNVRLDPWGGIPSAVLFHDLFGGQDIDIVTAARLSSTFPYVSPTPSAMGYEGERPSGAKVFPSDLHFADGGYSDTYGVTAGVSWLRTVQEELRQLDPKRPLYLLRLEPFPQSDRVKTSHNGLINELVNPIRTVLRVRGKSQRSTADTMLQPWVENRSLSGRSFHVLILRPDVEDGEVAPQTLSWHLTTKERERIWNLWKQLEARAQLTSEDPNLEALASLLELLRS